MTTPPQHTTLHEPLTLPCGQVLPNRIMKAALSEALGNAAHAPDHRLERLYSTWSAGGYGLVVTGNVMVDRTQLGEPGNVVIEDERDLDALSRWAKATKDGGVPIWVQLNHPGRQSNPLALGHRPVAPSAIPLTLPGSPTPRELTSAEIEDVIERFATAAAVCETAGFDGVQIHGAHGYLVAQFLSPLSNQRDDEWGGDPERRMRFLIEVVRRVRARVSPGFAVGLKLNSADFQRGGFTEDESRGVLAALAGEGLDLIEVSGGGYETPAMMGAAADSTKAREAYFLEYARTVRAVVGDVPIAVTGGFRSRAAMTEAVAGGECDVIGLGRPTVTTTDAADAILTGRSDQLEVHRVRAGLRGVLGKVVDLKSLDGILELSWHTDQLHRVGAGLEPDLGRGKIATTVAMVRRNGTTSFGRKRGL
ncbi:NADH:flavin oxidoreductase/NADH oxidase family protein [Mycolicibacterium sediminis]|uniref:Putative NADH:flavin oxidoreductase/NADH oxidase n=1 Tax=Mycolicibacterium sediminis TaxID=1286180 RepID=A0A7I7QS84_9MYCO|nr:NADH:flavin oxidoreductase/NADH oxidase family protein [Mycolicibacterium sediminis]BBY28920.1 putative NADH:flavin oxidoreductase/NADH oxidase [Mycolicibacterium sediminis]